MRGINKKGINKKGISAVVATVLIILITVAAVTIIWAAIIPMVQDQLDKATQCSNAVAQLTLKGAHSCFDNAANTVDVQVARGSQAFDLVDVQILIGEAGSTTETKLVAAAIATKEQLPKENENKVFTITGITGTPDSASVAPIIFIGNENVICENAGGSIPLKACVIP